MNNNDPQAPYLGPISYLLCDCSKQGGMRSYYWATSDWGECSSYCPDQVERRRVTCWLGFDSGASVEQPRETCLRAGLPEPLSTRPCNADVCYTFEKNTKCVGEIV